MGIIRQQKQYITTMETLEVTIIPEDFKNAPRGFASGVNNEGCVLQQALRRMFPETPVMVGHKTVQVGLGGDVKFYSINQQEWGLGEIPGGFSANAINEYSQKAKESLEGIPSKTLYLQVLALKSEDLPGAMVTRLANL